MALSGSPTFAYKEILTYNKLNDWAGTVETKFDGNIQAADISWPLVAQGNLDMNGNSIVGVSSLFNIYVVVDGFTFAQAVAAVNTDGGGVIYIPSGTTVTVEDVDITTGDVMIRGGGPDSIIKLGASVTDYGISFASSSDNILIADLTIDGNSQGAHGFQIAPSSNIQVRNVWGKSLAASHGIFSFQGSGDTVCSNVIVSSCRFSGNYISLDLDGMDKMLVTGCLFTEGKGIDVFYSDATAARPCRDISFSGCTFWNTDADCIGLTNGAAAGATRTNISISGCNFRGDSSGGEAIVLSLFRSISLSGNNIYLPGANGIELIDCDGGALVGNTITGPGGTDKAGISIDTDCTHISLVGNTVSAMTAGTASTGIKILGDDCALVGNVCLSSDIGIAINGTRVSMAANICDGNTAEYAITSALERAHNIGDE